MQGLMGSSDHPTSHSVSYRCAVVRVRARAIGTNLVVQSDDRTNRVTESAQHRRNRMMSRREWLGLSLTGGAAFALNPQLLRAARQQLITRAIPSTGEKLPIVGLG